MQEAQGVAAPATSATAPTLPALVDIPTLLRLPITQIRERLGKPAAERQADVYNSEHMLVYKLKGQELIVNYILKTGQVLEIALDVKRDVTDYTSLYTLGRLNRQDTSYVVTPLLSSESKHEGKCRGIIVSPHPPVEYSAD